METMEFHQYGECFDSPMRNTSESSSLSCDAFGGSIGLFDFGCNDYSISDFNDQGGSSDDEDIIDIEAIDELGGIMQSPDKCATFSSARTAPIAALTRRKSSGPVVKANEGSPQPKEAVFKQPTADAVPVKGTERVRHDSEQIVEDLVALQDKMGPTAINSGGSQSDLSLTPSLDHLRFDDSITGTQLETDEQFSLLGIDGIEADDLESLIMQFEGVIEDESGQDSPLKLKLLSPAPVAKPKLTLDDYRRLRGTLPSNNNEVPKVEEPPVSATPPAARAIRFANKFPFVKESTNMDNSTKILSKDLPMQGSTKPQAFQSIRNVQLPAKKKGHLKPLAGKQMPSKMPNLTNLPTAGTAVKKHIPATTLPKEFSLVIPVSGAAPTQTNGVRLKVPMTSVKQALHNIIHDHDYCTTKSGAAPGLSRDIRAELELLLKKIPEYLAASGGISSKQSSQTLTASTKILSIKQEPTTECSCDFKPKTRTISLDSSVHAQSSQKAVSSLPVKVEEIPLGLPKAYTLPSRGRPRKRRYRRRSPSYSSSSSSCSEDSDSDSCHNRCSSDQDSDSCSSCDSYPSKSQGRHKRQLSSYSRKTKRKTTRDSRSNRVSSHSQSRRAGRHKAPSNKKRRRHKSARSSQSVSPYNSTTSATSRSPSPSTSEAMARRRKEMQDAHNQAMAERRVVYVGGIGDRYTRADLRKRFGGFGEIENVVTRLRDNAENYGFVTFYSKADAYAAIEKGNDVYGPKFNLGFGGRRTFCDTEYADLDGCQAVKEEWAPSLRSNRSGGDDFDTLLQNSIKKIKT